jgi:acetyl esterase
VATSKPSWVARLLESPPTPGPPITSVEMIPERRSFLALPELAVDPPPGVDLRADVVLRERDGERLTAEIAVPGGEGPHPVLVYLHGGAWCLWSAAEVRRFTFRVASRGYVVISLNYGLAPERPFPWAVEDAIYGARWTARNAAVHGGDPDRIAIGGDSSGANLAAAATAFLAGLDAEVDEGDLAGVDVRLRAALLLYGNFDFGQRMLEPSTTPGTTEVMSNLAYLGPHFLPKHSDPLVSPIRASTLGEFPPTYLCCGDEDPTLPQSLAMTGALATAGVPATLSVVAGADHEFLLIDERRLPVVARESQRILDWLDEQLRSA